MEPGQNAFLEYAIVELRSGGSRSLFIVEHAHSDEQNLSSLSIAKG